MTTPVDKPEAATICVSPLATRPLFHRDDLWAVTTEELNRLQHALTASEKRRRETDMLAYKWMVAHDRLAAGLQYEFPSPANIPDALARVNELETFVRSVQVPTKDGTWKEVMFRLADEARVILAKGERS